MIGENFKINRTDCIEFGVSIRLEQLESVGMIDDLCCFAADNSSILITMPNGFERFCRLKLQWIIN